MQIQEVGYCEDDATPALCTYYASIQLKIRERNKELIKKKKREKTEETNEQNKERKRNRV